jgi:type IV secretory pathway TraG/TraD family ATPase VirD4
MVAAARLRTRGGHGSDHWTERAAALLAPLLHAAALEETSVGELAGWVDLHEGHGALAILVRRGASPQAAASLSGILGTDDRELSGIWSTTAGVLSAWRTDAARAAAAARPLELASFVRSSATLHIVSPSRHQASGAPVIAGLIDAIVHATYEEHRNGARVLLALDELANVAPLPSLPSIVSEGGAQGVTVLGCLQDLSQARVRWGAIAEGFLSLFPTAVVLRGIADRATLESLAAIAGRHDVPARAVARGRRGRPVVTTSMVTRPRLSVDEIARGRSGHALVVDAAKRLGWVRLTPAHLDARFRAAPSDP